MSWGRSNERWNHTASLMWLFACIYADPKSGVKPQLGHYHPYMPTPQLPQMPPEMLSALVQQMRGRPPEAARE